MPASALQLEATDIAVGRTHSFSVHITAETVRAFAELSGDFNPLHCREEYAKRFGFSGVVAHGAYQQALVSQSVGMWVIGERCLVSGLSSRFLNPLVCDITVQVSGEVVRWSPEKALGQVRVRIEGDGGSIVFSESTVDVTFHGAEVFLQTPADVRTEPEQRAKGSTRTSRKVVAVSGASSGIFSRILPALSETYDLILMGRNASVLEQLATTADASCTCEIAVCDWTDDHLACASELIRVLRDRSIWGVIHAASPKPSKSRVVEWTGSSFLKDMNIAGYSMITLAKVLTEHASSDGGRMVVLGSNYAVHNSPPTEFLRYGIGKSLSSIIGKALAVELAKNRVTVNLIAPDFVPLGMNAGTPDAILRMKAAANPMKRLCNEIDIHKTLGFLLSDGAEFVSGQEIVLSGGSL